MRVFIVWIISAFLALNDFELTGSVSAIFGALIIIALTICLRQNGQLKAEHIVIAFSGIFFSLYHTMTTNFLIQMLQSLCWWGAIYLLLAGSLSKVPVVGVRDALSRFAEITKYFLINILFISSHKNLLPSSSIIKKLKKSHLLSMAFTLTMLLAFNMFFMEINADYGSWIMYLWDYAIWLLSLINFTFILKLLCSAYLLNALLLIPNKDEIVIKSEFIKTIINVLMVIIPIVGLFWVFLIFQSQCLFQDLSSLEFKSLSNYVQKGFWELLIVAILGYVCWSFVHYAKNPEEKSYKLIKLLELFFITELVATCIFSLHKLIALEKYFGFKDQRLLAMAAAFLLLMTFVLSFFQVLGKISSSKIFRIQWQSLYLIVAVFSLVNLDLFITRVNPISYYNQEGKSLDYAYLLTNSYDNYRTWPELFERARKTGVNEPENYYWGRYSGLCPKSTTYYDGSKGALLNNNRIAKHVSLLKKQVENKSILKVNLRAYFAYQFLKDYQTEIEQFNNDIVEICKDRTYCS